VRGLDTYMDLASRYVIDFQGKWLGGNVPKEPLLGTPDLQALADLGSSMDRVTTMRMFPASQRLLLIFAGAAVLPLLPLLLFKYPMADLAEKLLATVFSV